MSPNRHARSKEASFRDLRRGICHWHIYGSAKSGSKRLLKAVEDLLGEIDVLPFDIPADAEYGGIRSELEAAGKPIGGNDLLIAAHAYAIGATVVTANTNEFKRIRGLNVENWLAWILGGVEEMPLG